MIFQSTEQACLDLALEGERRCKAGDCHKAVEFFEAAIQVGTDDLKTLGAIYSQLGNAYFYLQEYQKALEYHRLDLNLSRYDYLSFTCQNNSKLINIGLRLYYNLLLNTLIPLHQIFFY